MTNFQIEIALLYGNCPFSRLSIRCLENKCSFCNLKYIKKQQEILKNAS